MSKKVICHITGMHSAKYGAMEKYLLAIAKKSAEKGFSCVVQYETQPASITYVSDLRRENVSLEVLRSNGNPFLSLFCILKLLLVYRPSIVHTHFVDKYTLLLLPFFAKLFGVKEVIASVHNQKGFQKKSFVRFGFNAFTHVLPVSRAVKDDLKIAGVFEDKLDVLYLGIDGTKEKNEAQRKQLREENAIPGNYFTFASIAFDAPFKGVDILLKAFALLLKKRSDVFLLQIGVDPSRSSLVALARELGLSETNFKWMGIRDNGSDLLCAADCYVQPSRFGEGLPFAIMEAMSLRLPVLCTNVSGNVEAVENGKTGLVVPANDPERLSEGMLKMLTVESKSLGEQGKKKFMETFQLDTSVQTLLREYYGE